LRKDLKISAWSEIDPGIHTFLVFSLTIFGEQMNNKSKLILAAAMLVAAMMLLVPLTQTDLGGGYGKKTLQTQLF